MLLVMYQRTGLLRKTIAGHGLSVTGVTTLSSDLDLNASGNVSEDWVVTKDLSLSGHGLSVTGVTTLSSDLDLNASGNVSEDWVVTTTLVPDTDSVSLVSQPYSRHRCQWWFRC